MRSTHTQPEITNRPAVFPAPAARIMLPGVAVDAATCDEYVLRIRAAIAARARCHVVTANPEYAMRCRRDATLREIVARAEIVTADGAGLVAAARLLDRGNLSRVTGNDLVAALAAAGVPLFLLGAAPGIAENAAAALTARYPQAVIAGTWAGDASAAGDCEARRRINATAAQAILVAYGMPKQDHWIARNLPHLDATAAIGVGGVFDYLAGQVPRAPQWMRARGLEWFYRLVRQPSRWRRIVTVWQFAALVCATAIGQRIHHRRDTAHNV